MNVLNKNYKSLNNSLNENEKATTNLSKKLIDIFNNHNRELIKINASLVKANKSNQIKFQEFELNNSNQDIKIKELKDWLIYLTAFLLCVAIFYIVFSNI